MENLSKPTVSLFLDTRTIKKGGKDKGKSPLKLRVTYESKNNRSWSIGFSFTEDEYAKLNKNFRKDPYKDTWLAIDAKVKKAESIIDGLMPFFSFEEFKERFLRKGSIKDVSDKSSLLYIMDLVREELIIQKRLGMAKNHHDSVQSILKFAKRDNLSMRMITPTFCQQYEDYMLKKSKTKTRNGAGINLRQIRILFNEAIDRGLIPADWYPFNKYSIPYERKTKQYLTEDELVDFKEFKFTSTEQQRFAQDMFLVSYYCNGSNPADFLRFKYNDIKDGFIVFYRQKIKNSRKANLKPVRVAMIAELKEIIDRIGNDPSIPDNYIFNVLERGMTDAEEYKKIRRVTNAMSKSLKTLAKNLGLGKNITIGKARHTLANILKDREVNREFIKDLFAHTSIVTTEHYLESFDSKKHLEIMNSVAAIGKKKDEAA